MFSRKPKIKFEKREFSEYQGPMSNPGRGFYSMYRIDIASDTDFPELDDSLLGAGSLVLIEILLTGYNRSEMDEAGIRRTRETFEYFITKGRQLIVRFVYDVDGKGLENEPNRFDLVENHMRTLGPVTAEFKNDILVVQGVFVGSWGEMHTSKFLTTPYFKKLVKIWNEVTGASMPFALRRPDFIRMCIGADGEARGEYKNFAFYNDGMFGSDDDLGTYGFVTSMDVVWPGLRQRDEELKFLEPITDVSPYGGEILSNQFIFNPEYMIEEMRKLHMTYLNKEYDKVVLSRLAQTLGPEDYGISGHRSMLDYIGDHLGYRFIVRDAELSKDAKTLSVYIENVGFSRLFGQGTIGLVIRKEGESARTVSSSGALSKIGAGKLAKISFNVPDDLTGENTVSLEMYYNGIYPIRPANNGANVVFEIGTINVK